MLSVEGPSSRHRRRVHRREMLRTGALGLLGAASTMSFSRRADGRQSDVTDQTGFGRAKQCLVLYIYGAWSQLDTFDPKPNAPSEIRGEFGTIQSRLPDVWICEHLPRVAQVLDRVTLIRSMSHPRNIHSAAYTLTGNPQTELIEGKPRHPDHWPYLGGVIDYLGDLRNGEPSKRGVPRNVLLPWRQTMYASPNRRAGTFGGFLGSAYDPLCTNFRGEYPQGDPFREVTSDGRFVFDTGETPHVTLDVLNRRRTLLEQLDEQYRKLEDSTPVRELEKQRERACDFLSTPSVRDAIRVQKEPAKLREAYGMTLFGQACLAGRRLIESGVKLVTVVWDEFGKSDESWDTHYDHHPRMKEFLLPGFDRAFSTLIHDMDERGLLDDTLVLCLSEHGRTPRLNGSASRDHWSTSYCQLFAGAGVPRGQVVGESDESAAYATKRLINPKDVLHTAYHLLGVDPLTELEAVPGRPVPLVADGRLIPELIG